MFCIAEKGVTLPYPGIFEEEKEREALGNSG